MIAMIPPWYWALLPLLALASLAAVWLVFQRGQRRLSEALASRAQLEQRCRYMSHQAQQIQQRLVTAQRSLEQCRRQLLAYSNERSRLAEVSQQVPDLRRQLAEQRQQSQHLQGELREQAAARAQAEERNRRVAELERQLAAREGRLAELGDAHARVVAERAALETRLEEQEQQSRQRLEDFEQARALLAEAFENMTNRALQASGATLREQSRAGLEELLAPVRQQLGDFRARLDEIHGQESRERASLATHLEQLQRLNLEMADEARQLSQAMRASGKTRGTWGEMLLERVLEQSGLRRGKEYRVQGSFRDADNRMLRPDVVVHLPDQRDVVIDSKVSLNAYQDYLASDDGPQRQAALARHLQSVRQHLRDLGGKNYAELEGVRSLDFVLMFMPVEGAFSCAFDQDESLFSEAFGNKIVVVTPTTLLATLRTIENLWRFQRQNENARMIAQRAGGLYDKLRLFLVEFDKIGIQLDNARASYDQARGRLVQGRGNLVAQAQSFVELGVKVKTELPREASRQALLANQQEN
jgi:DNA recombination protein RmuC